jgi:hypothetical protein
MLGLPGLFVGEDTKLTSAVRGTYKKKCGKKYKTAWAAVAALLPGRTKRKCSDRWRGGINPIPGRVGKWAADEDKKLKDAVPTHGGDKS